VEVLLLADDRSSRNILWDSIEKLQWQRSEDTIVATQHGGAACLGSVNLAAGNM